MTQNMKSRRIFVVYSDAERDYDGWVKSGKPLAAFTSREAAEEYWLNAPDAEEIQEVVLDPVGEHGPLVPPGSWRPNNGKSWRMPWDSVVKA